MKIRCKQEREGGTQVTLGLTTYNFQPNARGEHVATVTDEAHQKVFLGIPEGYEEYQGEAAAVVKALPPAGAVVPAQTKPAKMLTRKQLEKAYVKQFGKKPNARSKDETIAAALGLTNG